MSKKSFNSELCIGPLNNVKRGLQMADRPFSKETMLNSLKSCGLPVNGTFWSVFRNSGIIQEVSKGYFMFTSKEPIYVGTLNAIKHKYQQLTRKYAQNNKRNNIVEEAEVLTPEVNTVNNNPDATIQSAINLLKENGYKIFAPVGVVYQQV